MLILVPITRQAEEGPSMSHGKTISMLLPAVYEVIGWVMFLPIHPFCVCLHNINRRLVREVAKAGLPI